MLVKSDIDTGKMNIQSAVNIVCEM